MKRLSVYTDKEKSNLYDEEEYESSKLSFDTSHMVERFLGADEIVGVCLPVCAAYAGYGGGHNTFLLLEHETRNRFRRVGLLKLRTIGKWISGWSGTGTDITLV